MSRTKKSNWKIVTMLALMGAFPALPGIYIMVLILLGPPPDGAQSFVRAHYFVTPAPILLHATAGAIFAALIPFQFAHRLRARRPRLHRITGRTAVAAGFVLALSGIWMLMIFPPSGGWLRTSGLATIGIGTIITLSIALHAIMVRRNFRRHRVWMMHSIALVFAPLGSLTLALVVFVIMGESPDFIDETDRWVGMAVNLSIVQWVLYRERGGRRKLQPAAA